MARLVSRNSIANTQIGRGAKTERYLEWMNLRERCAWCGSMCYPHGICFYFHYGNIYLSHMHIWTTPTDARAASDMYNSRAYIYWRSLKNHPHLVATVGPDDWNANRGNCVPSVRTNRSAFLRHSHLNSFLGAHQEPANDWKVMCRRTIGICRVVDVHNICICSTHLLVWGRLEKNKYWPKFNAKVWLQFITKQRCGTWNGFHMLINF